MRKEADLRPLVEHYGFGEQFNVHAVGVRPRDTAEEVARYLSKYLRRPRGEQTTRALRDVREQQRKLLDLYYADAISAELFAQDETRRRERLVAAYRERVQGGNAC